MREIKFRVWNNEENKWDNPYLDFLYECGAYQINNIFERKKFTFQQFTGLKDKNNKEIYEGDIVQITDEWFGSFNVGRQFVVAYINAGFYPFNNGYSSIDKHGEVIGNIYEPAK